MTKRALIFFILLVSVISACWVQAGPSELDLEAQLIWGTNDEKSPDPNHKDVDPAVAKKLSHSPYKWKNYFEVNRQKTSVAAGTTQKLVMSKQCEIEIKNLNDDRIEVKLFGNKKPVSRHVTALPPGQIFIVGGDAKNDTAWLIVIKRAEAKK